MLYSMDSKARRAVGVLLILWCACGVWADQPALKGVAISPAGFPDHFDNIFEFLDEVGSWTNQTLMWNGAWQDEDEPGAPPPGESPRAPGFVWSNAPTYGYTPVQVFGWRDDTNLLLAVPGNPTNDWTNEDAKALFIGMLTNYAVEMPSPYIFIGNENDFYYKQDPVDYARWVAFYHDAYDAIKAVAPTTKVGTVFSYEHMAGIGVLNAWTNEYWEALDLFDLDRIDVVGITTYPFFGLATPDQMPRTYYDLLIDRIGDKPIAFTEIGWPAEDLFDSFTPPWETSEAAQVGFLERLPRVLFGRNVEFVQWPFLHRLADPAETNDWWSLFASVSLYDAEEDPRPAYAVYLSMHIGPYRAPLAVYHPPGGAWYVRALDGTILAWNVPWGWNTVTPIVGDFSGDGMPDLAVYHEATGRWFIRALDGTVLAWSVNWGFPGATAVPGDFNGDGRLDLAVYHEATGRWFVRSLDGTVLVWDVNWGFPGAQAVPGDYNNSGQYDLAVYHEATGRWFIRSLDGTVLAWSVNWGFPGATAAPGDYDGDGRYDLAVYHEAAGHWFIRSLDGTVLAWNVNWGFPGGAAITGDYDGDGRADLAIVNRQTGQWYIRRVAGGILGWNIQWGFPGTVYPGQ